MLLASLLAAFLLVVTEPAAKDYPSWGSWLNWILGLPCWLVGCRLAEATSEVRLSATARIWHWRLGIWGASAICSALRYHSAVGYPWTLNLFAIAVGYWLNREIRIFQARKPLEWLEWMGKWSYSIYLAHVPARAFLAQFALPNLGHALNWIVQMVLILGACYVFYLSVERPAHFLARAVGGRIGKTTQ
jgi:peptidoglycan/LPS O-acetylase OafA/YrhL